MQSMSNNRHPRARGFSLVELLAVIMLLGIIAGIVVPKVFGQAEKGKWNASKTKVSSVSAKIESYALDVGQPPERLEDLYTKPGNSDNWSGPYARASDLKDGWGRTFEYKSPGEHGDFDLISLGSDGKPGGENWARDIGNWE
ncbi:MAG TPA: type II secretion system major pseudopilin GspG [Patescibacteria group bacterium]|nr:type II secretion system major pseudopilin GspG [Patescibacteria group bacterium]